MGHFKAQSETVRDGTRSIKQGMADNANQWVWMMAGGLWPPATPPGTGASLGSRPSTEPRKREASDTHSLKPRDRKSRARAWPSK